MVVFLMILKYIGIVLLCILGLVLLLGCLVLFVPIRYRVDGTVPEKGFMESDDAWKKRIAVTAKVTWLLHALSVRAILPDEHNLYVRILGIRVIPTKEDTATTGGVRRERFGRLKKALRWIWGKIRWLFGKLVHGGRGNVPGSLSSTGRQNAPVESPPDSRPQGEALDDETSFDIEEEIFTEEELAIKEDGVASKNTNLKASMRQKKEEAAELRKDHKVHRKEEAVRRKEAAAQRKAKAKRLKADKKRCKQAKAARQREDDRTLFEKLEDGLNKIYYTISGIYDKIDLFDRIWNSTAFQEAFAFLKKRLIQLLKAILPRRFDAYAHIGTGDPKSTADILALYGILYPAHRGNLAIDADFEEQVYDGELHIRGRIYLFRILFLLATCYFDKNVRVSLKRIRRLIRSDAGMTKQEAA